MIRMLRRGGMMVSVQSVTEQLKRVNFVAHIWNRAEVRELPNILLPDEEIYECANGAYEGGLAVLVATNVRVLLIDKKLLNYLTVEDLRFDMINEIDYSHRLMGAYISISAGAKNLRFTSYNQPRLRKLINHVQHCIAEAKKLQNDHQLGQNQRLEQINQQLQAYLFAQHENQQALSERLQQAEAQGVRIEAPQTEPVRPDPQLADYLFAQSLLKQHGVANPQPPVSASQQLPLLPLPPAKQPGQTAESQLAELYAEGVQEVFGKHQVAATKPKTSTTTTTSDTARNPLEINPLRIAYSKLPMVLRNRKFSRRSFNVPNPVKVKPPLLTTPMPPSS